MLKTCDVKVVVLLHPSEISTGRAKLTNHVLARAVSECKHTHWHDGETHGVIINVQAKQPLTKLHVVFTESGSAVSWVILQCTMASVFPGLQIPCVVMQPVGENETMYANVANGDGRIVACLSQIHRPKNRDFKSGELIEVKVLSASWNNGHLFVTATFFL